MATTQTTQKLIKHLDEAVAMEQAVLRMLGSLARTTRDEATRNLLEEHQRATRQHIERLEGRLRAHGSSPSLRRNASGAVIARAKTVVDVVRREKPGRNARDAFAAENLEVAGYELLERVATNAGDKETAEVARKNKSEDRAMAGRIAENWDRYAELSLADGGGDSAEGQGGLKSSLSSALRNPVVLGVGSVAVGALLGRRRGGQASVTETQTRKRGGREEQPLADLPKGELQRRAEKAGVTVRRSMTKQQLIDALTERVRTTSKKTAAASSR